MKRINFLGWFFDLVFVALLVLMFVKSDPVVAVFAVLLLLKCYATNRDLNRTKKQLKEYREITEILINRFNAHDGERKS